MCGGNNYSLSLFPFMIVWVLFYLFFFILLLWNFMSNNISIKNDYKHCVAPFSCFLPDLVIRSSSCFHWLRSGKCWTIKTYRFMFWSLLPFSCWSQSTICWRWIASFMLVCVMTDARRKKKGWENFCGCVCVWLLHFHCVLSWPLWINHSVHITFVCSSWQLSSHHRNTCHAYLLLQWCSPSPSLSCRVFNNTFHNFKIN